MNWFKEAKAIEDFTIEKRRDFHQNPEIGFEEVRTSGIVVDTLRDLGLEVRTGVGKTGVVGLLKGHSDSPVLLMRFDMDALPIQEATGAVYASHIPGKMHACGHDSHVAVGLSVAKILAAHRAQIPGTIKFVFQPAEEGQGGARLMVEEGVLNYPRPDYAMAMHVWNEMPVGWFALTPGPTMAGAVIFNVRITGKGGHGAAPHQTVDPIIAAAQIINALQSIVSRNLPPLETAVVSVCKIKGGTAFNIIPQDVTFDGTIRTFKESVYAKVIERFEAIINQMAEAMGCQAEITIEKVTLPVDNDAGLVSLMTEVVKDLQPEAKVDSSHRTMGSEDFSFMMDDIPGCFMMVGSSNPEKGLDYGHHHPKFDIDESCLAPAVAILAKGAVEILRQSPKSI